jgi:flavin-dependent dehydrogenase
LERALVTTPREVAFTGGWPAATPWGTTIERRTFDAGIVDAAVRAGVRFMPATAVTAIETHTSCIVASTRTAGDEGVVRADVAIVAEGATGGLASKLGFPDYRSRLVALRAYADAPQTLEPKYGLFYDRLLTPGYGWVFPIDERQANVGICIDEKTLALRGGDLRSVFVRWLAESRFARALLGDRPNVRDVRGGIIPTGRRVRTKPGVFLIGDAAGVADPFTAEGIYQAMHSARLLVRALEENASLDAARSAYERSLRIFDRNEGAARALRTTFGLAIEPYAKHAAANEAFADHLNTDVFFPKRSFASFVWRLIRAW